LTNKTAHEDGLDPKTVLPKLRGEFAPQIEAYAKMLRNLHGADLAVRGGLYYPRMALLDCGSCRRKSGVCGVSGASGVSGVGLVSGLLGFAEFFREHVAIGQNEPLGTA